jgi:membrane protein implicated in regulation of membrane protease activity
VEHLSVWWESITTVQQILLFITAPATLVLIIQTVMVLFGGDIGTDVDTDIDTVDFEVDSGFALFSLRGIMAFFSVGGILGITMIATGMNLIFAMLIAFAGGSATLWFIAFLMNSMKKLQSSGNMNMNNAINKTGVVYLPILDNQPGKIHLTFQGRYTELNATANEALPRNTQVKVIKIIDNDVVFVEKILES